MRTAIAILTFTLVNLFSTPSFAQQPIRTEDMDFTPVAAPVAIMPYSASSGNTQAVRAVYKDQAKQGVDYNEVMFYIPVYTMKVKTKETSFAAPVSSTTAGLKGPNVIMPVYSNIDKSKHVTSPSSTNPGSSLGNGSGSGGGNGGGGNNGGLFPDNPNISDGSGNAGGGGNLLPQNPSVSTDSPAPSSVNNNKSIIAAAPIITGLGFATFKRGTKVKVKLCDELTSEDRLYKKLTFITTEPVVTTYSTIPIGTCIKGEIIKNESPKKAGDVAVMALRPRKIEVDEKLADITGVVVKADQKKVFFNNIKGKGTYVSGLRSSQKAGKEYFSKMSAKSQKLAQKPLTALFSPLPVIGGAAGYALKSVVSPVTALAGKGEPIKIASGSEFELKLTSDCELPLKK